MSMSFGRCANGVLHLGRILRRCRCGYGVARSSAEESKSSTCQHQGISRGGVGLKVLGLCQNGCQLRQILIEGTTLSEVRTAKLQKRVASLNDCSPLRPESASGLYPATLNVFGMMTWPLKANGSREGATPFFSQGPLEHRRQTDLYTVLVQACSYEYYWSDTLNNCLLNMMFATQVHPSIAKGTAL